MKQIITFFLVLSLYTAQATIWQVGPSKTYKNCSQVSTLVQNGDTVQIDFATYTNVTQVLWTKNNLYIVGVGGRPRLEAGSTIANDMVNGKGIFVISGSNVKVENIEFANAKVVDRNGAGIRQEGANLLVTRCRFVADEMGILCGRILNCKITVEYSEFLNGGSTLNPGYQHNIYIGNIDTFVFRYNYSHEAIAEGHELKSRAAYNFILYNRIANEQTVDSRTIDLPNGGTSVIVGNIIEQGVNSANTNLLGYGLEGLTNAAPHSLWICNNTFVNKKTSGSFIHIAAGTDTLFLKNNILAGAKTGGLIIGTPTVMDSARNFITNTIASVNFVNATTYDYHLLVNSAARDAGIAVTKTIKGYALQPTLVYKDICNFEARKLIGTIDIGAFEYITPSVIETISNTTRLYPNPTNGFVFWEGEGFVGEHFYIYNALGRLVKTGIVEQQVDMTDLHSGLYFFKIKQRCYTVSKIN
jgi:hypothetical protein